MVGDPSGRTDMRSMMTKETIDYNIECFNRTLLTQHTSASRLCSVSQTAHKKLRPTGTSTDLRNRQKVTGG